MPLAVRYTTDRTIWKPLSNRIQSNQLHGTSPTERLQCLLELGLPLDTKALLLDSGEVWWLDTGLEDPYPHHPVGCERFSIVKPEWPGKWVSTENGWWKRVASFFFTALLFGCQVSHTVEIRDAQTVTVTMNGDDAHARGGQTSDVLRDATADIR